MHRLLSLLVLLGVGCASETDPLEPRETPEPAAPAIPVAPTLETRADSVAWRIVEASGGLAAWEALPGLRFDFGVERDGQQQIAARHLWDKRTGRYRVEWPADEAGTYVGLFSAWPDSVRVYFDGQRVADPALETEARRRTINDQYWLLAPLKLFDPGVTRTAAPDSSDAATDAIRLSFDDVGMTPGDQYWLFADRETGQLVRWTFLLQDDATGTPRSFRWTGYASLQGPAGPVSLATRKESTGGPVAILTDRLGPIDAPDASVFTDPQPRLQ
ncbi:MAG: hypothetical protein R3362_07590 [Rhodothermales bacterium]|nr:hypothetical protein [Rhodothermales bacterium]